MHTEFLNYLFIILYVIAYYRPDVLSLGFTFPPPFVRDLILANGDERTQMLEMGV
jgi:hypothetical protein